MAKPVRIVSWNINSVRLPAPNVEAFVAAEKPDVICLQETKCQNAEFPLKAFKEMGLGHVVLRGQRGGHAGVAIASRLPLEEVDTPDLCREGHARVIAARLKSGLEIHNIYLPAGPPPISMRATPASFSSKLRTASEEAKGSKVILDMFSPALLIHLPIFFMEET